MPEKIVLILDNGGGPLAREEVSYEPGDDPAEAENLAIHAALEDWPLSAGDTIKIYAADHPEAVETVRATKAKPAPANVTPLFADRSFHDSNHPTYWQPQDGMPPGFSRK